MCEIFLSPSGNDYERAKIIIENLEQNGFSVWSDRNVPIGIPWDEFIQTKLANAKCIVVLWSKESIKSDYVKEEAEEGKKRKIYCPVLIDDVELPFGFKRIEAAKLMGWNGEFPNTPFDELLKCIGDCLNSNKPRQIGDQKHEPKENPETIHNSIYMKFKLIPVGEFRMGSETGYGDEIPVQGVTIKKSFYLNSYPVTLCQWKSIMGSNPSPFNGDDLLVVNVSWNDVQEFIKTINKKEGTNKYRLPSEAEWEYVARAGKPTQYFFGYDESKLSRYAWYAENSSLRAPNRSDHPFYDYDYKDWKKNEWNGKIHPVGEKEPNT